MTHSTTPIRICTKCNKEFPATAEYFYRQKLGLYGLNSVCKECRAKSQRIYRENHRELVRERDRIHRAAHREQILEYSRRYRLTHREQRLEYGSAYRAANRERAREKARAWRAANPERTRVAARRRRARDRNAEGSHTAEDVQQQYDNQRGRCYYAACGHSKLNDTFHVDHVIPLTRGGSDDLSNLVLTCPTCNLKKYNKLPSEWPEGGRLL